MTCIVCGKNIERESPNSRSVSPERDMWIDAVVHVLWAGFGSKFDTSGFVVAVCDACVEKKLAEGVIERKQ